MRTTIGNLLINQALPPDLRAWDRVLDRQGTAELFQQIADKHPDQYKEIAKRLSDVGRHAATSTGGYGFGIRSLKQTIAGKQMRYDVGQKLKKIYADKSLSEKDRDEAIIKEVGGRHQKLVEDVIAEGKATNHPLVMQSISGMRGNKFNVNSLMGADLLYTDHRDKVIPSPVLRSYSQGLTPAEYFASSFGARKGIVAIKSATADAGYWGKQVAQMAHRLVVSAEDDNETPSINDTPRGLPVDTHDPDNAGALLAKAIGHYGRNTVLTPKILKELKAAGHGTILIRSPLVGGPADGGVYARDVGHREKGRLAPLGDYVGIAAAQSLSEPLSQSQLCLAIGTLVRMADRSVRPIEEIKAGDMVIGADRAGNAFPVRVVRVHDNGIRDCVRTRFRVASTQEFVELVSTPDHKLLATARYWALPHQKIVSGVFPVSEKCVGYGAEMVASVAPVGGTAEPFGLLLGLLLGDGCYTRSVGGAFLSCFDPTLIEDIAPYLDGLELRIRLCPGQRGYWRISQKKDTTRQDPITGRLLPGFRNPALLKLQEYRMYGKYAHDKCIPDEVWGWDTESIRALISGLFVTDGSIYRMTHTRGTVAGHVNFGSTSLPMIMTLRELLRVVFGIHTGPIRANVGKRKRSLHSFVITRRPEVLKFAERIPLYGIKKVTLAEIIAQWEPYHDKNCSRYYRREQKPSWSMPTYDLEVDHPDHLFVLANGLIVSNSSKHIGGVAAAGSKAVTGFKAIDNLIQAPEVFAGAASHAQVDGRVTSVTPAPQGGHYVMVDAEKHYVPASQAVTVKRGDPIEAGDRLSDGFANPAEITHHKGIGEGRRLFTKGFHELLAASGIPAHRRNVELLARGLINHVRLTDEMGDYAPDDVIPYQTLEKRWEPRPGHVIGPPKTLLGHYLERPVLHHSIGTKIRPSMLSDLEKHGVKNVTAHREPPPFEPEFIRGMANVSQDPDWMVRMLGSYQQKSLLEGTRRGATSDELGTSYVPALAHGINFGRMGPTQGWQP